MTVFLPCGARKQRTRPQMSSIQVQESFLNSMAVVVVVRVLFLSLDSCVCPSASGWGYVSRSVRPVYRAAVAPRAPSTRQQESPSVVRPCQRLQHQLLRAAHAPTFPTSLYLDFLVSFCNIRAPVHSLCRRPAMTRDPLFAVFAVLGRRPKANFRDFLSFFTNLKNLCALNITL